MNTIKNKTGRISKEQWLAKGLAMLESTGIESVKIQRLAKALGTSRSGFYWHFKDRQDLLAHILNYWKYEYTGVVTGNPDVLKLSPEKRLLAVIRMIRDRKLSKYDLAMAAWAKADPQAEKIVKMVVEMRLDYLREIFADLGFEDDELEMRTRLFVCYHSWEETMFPDLSDKQHSKLLKLRYQLFIKH